MSTSGTGVTRVSSRIKPDQQTLEVVDHVDSDGKQWIRRRKHIAALIGATSTCALLRANPAGAMNRPAPSLGLIKPYVDAVTIAPGRPWTPNQRAKAEFASAPTLFGDEMAILEPMPFRLTYHYHCIDGGCRGHQQQCVINSSAHRPS